MLGAMDVPASAAGPWIALGAVLGVLLLLAVGAVALRMRSGAGASVPGADAEPPTAGRDDLADFLACPPGTPGARDHDSAGWTSLAPPPPPARRDERLPAPDCLRPGRVILAFAVAALLLVGVAAALAAAARSEAPERRQSSPGDSADATVPLDRDDVTARLVFTGVVLEEHAVGITAAYPELELTVDGDDADAHLLLPTANCLAVAAPLPAGDPACRAARTEYADLSAPGLRVDRDGDRLRVSGRFATYLRLPGGATERTGRSYDVAVTVTPAGDRNSGRVPAEARLEWGEQRAETRTDAPSTLLRGG